MVNDRKRIILILSLLIVVCLMLIGFSFSSRGKPQAGKAPSKDVLNVVQAYVQAREDSLGADKVTSNSWLTVVKPISTTAWYNTLQPAANQPTGSTPYDFTTAHQNGYVIKALLTNCAWDNIIQKPSATSGLVVCNLSDETIDKQTGAEVPAGSLPFGWSYTGPQQPAQINVVKQSSKWLVSGDSTGQAQ